MPGWATRWVATMVLPKKISLFLQASEHRARGSTKWI